MESKVYKPEEIRGAIFRDEISVDDRIHVLLNGIPMLGVLVITSGPLEDIYGEIPETIHFGLNHHGHVFDIS